MNDDFNINWDLMYDAAGFDNDSWNLCVEFINSKSFLDTTISFGQAAAFMRKFREILIRKMERLKDKNNVDMDKVLDWIR